MFEIGNALIQARHRLGLELTEVERETKLRVHYLRALEQEQFDELPQGYRRSFLRSYAAFLGLDADLLVDEYTVRYEPYEPHVLESLPRPLRSTRRRPVPLAALGLVALAVAGLAAAVLLYGRGSPKAHSGAPATTVSTSGRHTTAPTTSTPRRGTTRTATTPAQRSPVVRVTLAAVGGPCWLSVHKGSAQGPIAYEGTLQPGQSVNLRGSRYWARIGAPSALSLTVAGKAQTLPPRTGNVLIDARGVTTAP